MSLPLEWADRLQPPAGKVVVERDERPIDYHGLIVIPESVRLKTKSSAATVVASEHPALSVGDRVMVNAGVGRRMIFGQRQERVLYICWPYELLAVIHVDQVDEEGGHHQRFGSMHEVEERLSDRRDEGVSYGRSE